MDVCDWVLKLVGRPDVGTALLLAYGGTLGMWFISNRGAVVSEEDSPDGGGAGEESREVADDQAAKLEKWRKGEQDLMERNRQRREQEKAEKGDAWYCVKQHVGVTSALYSCSDMGSRLQKNWLCVWTVVTAAPLSKNCRLTLNYELLKLLNKTLRHLKHPHLLPVLSIDYNWDLGQVMVTQHRQRASLRDLIYQQSDPSLDWAEKYWSGERGTQPLPSKAVAGYGRQILEAVVYLYEQGFPSLGHIQTGNIFVNFTQEEVDGVVLGAGEGAGLRSEGAGARRMVDTNLYCRLGGYENTLLGYRPRLYMPIADADKLARIDIITFGHVMYEMMCGRELAGVEPTNGDYAAVYDDDLRTLLQDIFSLDMEDRKGIPEILSWRFFSEARTHCLWGEWGKGETSNIPDNLRAFLTKYFGHKGTRCTLS